jgi:3-oxoadipate enol-lactonase
MPFADSGDLRIYYELSTPADSSAPRLLFIGGTGGDLRVTPSALDGPLAKRFNMLAYDQRGLGQTEIPQGPYTMAQYGDDAAAILDHVGWESAHVCGVSFGGMVAQHLVLRHPKRANRLVLACTSCGGEGKASYPLHEIHHLKDRERFEFMLGISDTRNGPDWQEGNPERVDQMWRFTLNQRKGLPVTETSERGAFLQIEARKEHDTSARLHEIRSETFICGGRYDGLAPPSNLEVLHEGIPGSTLRFYEGGHLFMIQDRTAMKDIAAFLESA